jgi:tetratricopeptide (TPR) repeat protein
MNTRLIIIVSTLCFANLLTYPQEPKGTVTPPPKAPPTGTNTTVRPPPVRNLNLDLANTYERLKQWQEAEKYFQEAAKFDGPVLLEALLGIERVRTAAEAGSQEMAGGQYYLDADLPEKAEGEFVGALKSGSDSTRYAAKEVLR